MATTTTTAKAPRAGARRAGTKKKEKKNVPHGVASIAATFNNTIVAITDAMGNVLAWSSAVFDQGRNRMILWGGRS